jgi:hypothetical protein
MKHTPGGRSWAYCAGRIVRPAILAIAEGRSTGDLSTMEDASVLEAIRQEVEAPSRKD